VIGTDCTGSCKSTAIRSQPRRRLHCLEKQDLLKLSRTDYWYQWLIVLWNPFDFVLDCMFLLVLQWNTRWEQIFDVHVVYLLTYGSTVDFSIGNYSRVEKSCQTKLLQRCRHCLINYQVRVKHTCAISIRVSVPFWEWGTITLVDWTQVM
jgi:hypothetical protein